VKGGEGTKGLVDCGSSAYWAVVMLPATVALPLTYSFGKELVYAGERKKQLGFKAERGDIKWDDKCTTLYPAICFACGIAAGALGIAAGMILSPVLLELGMSPAVAAATSGFAVLFTSSCTRYDWFICFLVTHIIIFLQPAISSAGSSFPILWHCVRLQKKHIFCNLRSGDGHFIAQLLLNWIRWCFCRQLCHFILHPKVQEDVSSASKRRIDAISRFSFTLTL
jgi:hypothetical protein